MKDYYKVLGVSPGAPTEVIKAAYRALMKKHHPDVGGDPETAKEIEEAYRNLTLALEPSFPLTPGVRRQRRGEIVPAPAVGRHLEIQIGALQPNQVFTCPRECGYYSRSCRYKQLLSLESEDLFAFRASTLILHVRNGTAFSQQMDCRNGRAVLVDQMGDFYQCHQVCSWQHPPKYKEAGVELFPGTRATVMLWFPQLPPGRRVSRFVYKHKVLVRGTHGDWLDEELFELTL
mgnify:CR=1 FL=1|jgi:hypothetical protein